MGDISAHMNEVSPLLQARATKLIRMLTVKKKIPGDTDHVFPLNPHPREKKTLSLRAAIGAARYETKPGFFSPLCLSV